MNNSTKHKDKKVVITGGTRGIGHAIAMRLKNEGAEVLITGTKLNKLSSNFQWQQVDFSIPEQLEDFSRFLKQFSPDILINNAGINKINNFSDIELADFNRIQEVNIFSPFQLCQAVIPGMRSKGWGRIINIASIWSKISKAGRASYSASKFALDGMTAALAAEVAKEGILVNCVSPGFIETELTKSTLGVEGMREMIKQVPIGRLGQPEEIAAFVSWLVSSENTYISGQNMVIDGGFVRV